ncbi:MAG: hypothetical protein ACP5HU_04105 [Phycisphaerae bacterium]
MAVNEDNGERPGPREVRAFPPRRIVRIVEHFGGLMTGVVIYSAWVLRLEGEITLHAMAKHLSWVWSVTLLVAWAAVFGMAELTWRLAVRDISGGNAGDDTVG